MFLSDEHVRKTIFPALGRRVRVLPFIGLLAAGLAGPGQAAPAGKVKLCHLPPDNPENVQTIIIDEADVDEHLAHGGPGAVPGIFRCRQ